MRAASPPETKAQIDPANCGVFTSGNQRQFIEISDQRDSQIVAPASGTAPLTC